MPLFMVSPERCGQGKPHRLPVERPARRLKSTPARGVWRGTYAVGTAFDNLDQRLWAIRGNYRLKRLFF
jgi:hypothetical protein